MENIHKRKCAICGNPLKGRQKRFCSAKCKDKNKNTRKTHQFTCKYCGATGYSNRKSQQFCNLSCSTSYNNLIKDQTTTNNPNWRGGRYINPKGYVVCHVSFPHPLADKQGRILEHRLVVDIFSEKPLEKDEVVHHINGDKTDNRLENLMVMSKAEHDKLHREQKKAG